jgi:hypothetical protein
MANCLSLVAAFVRRAWQFRSRHNSPRLPRERDFDPRSTAIPVVWPT